MGPFIKIPVLLFVAFISPTLLVGCSAPKPSESEVKELVRATLKKNGFDFTYGMRRILDEDPDALQWDMEEVSIEKWGSYNEEKKYWPVQIRIRGSLHTGPKLSEKLLSSPIPFLKHIALNGQEFDKVGNAILYQNDYSEWQVKVEWRDKD